MKRYALFLMIILLISACKKKDGPDPVPVSNEIMKIDFSNNFIPDPFKVIVFISSPDGSLFADTSFTDNGLHTILNEKAGAQIPDTFSVTIARYDLYWHNLLIQINTFTDIVAGSVWELKGAGADTLGHATVHLDSVPEHTGLLLYSNQGYFNYTSSVKPQNCPIYQQNDDFYVLLNTTAGGFRYRWLQGIEPGKEYFLALSSAEVPAFHPMLLPFEAAFVDARLWGYPDGNYTPGQEILFDLELSGIQPQDTITLKYPPGDYANYRTRVEILQDFSSDETYICNVTGTIPQEFPEIQAGISDLQFDGNSINFKTSGSYDAARTFLYFYSSANEIFEWYIYMPASGNAVVVPELSPLLGETFPSVDTANFTLKNGELMDFHHLASYNELLDALFTATKAHQIDQLDYSSVKKATGGSLFNPRELLHELDPFVGGHAPVLPEAKHPGEF